MFVENWILIVFNCFANGVICFHKYCSKKKKKKSCLHKHNYVFSDIRVVDTGSGSLQKMKGEARKPTGLVVSTTELIRSFLSTASEDPHLSPELQQIASDLLSQHNVPYKSLRALWFASQPTTRPTLIQLFSGSDFVFTTPKPRHKVTHFLISSFLSCVWLMGKFRKENVLYYCT